MIWCNCPQDDYFLENITNIDDNGADNFPKCGNCYNRISNDVAVILLLREVNILKQTVESLKLYKEKRELEEEKEEYERLEEDRIAMKKIDKQSQRFEILDL